MERGTIKLCPIQLDGLAFCKAPYKYYVKGTTLRLLRNMTKKDLTAENNNGWIGCDTRNKAKRLITSNRKVLKIFNKIKDYIFCHKDIKLVCTHRNGILYIPNEK